MQRSTSQGSIGSPMYSRHNYTPTMSKTPQHFHRPGERDSFLLPLHILPFGCTLHMEVVCVCMASPLFTLYLSFLLCSFCLFLASFCPVFAPTPFFPIPSSLSEHPVGMLKLCSSLRSSNSDNRPTSPFRHHFLPHNKGKHISRPHIIPDWSERTKFHL